MSSTVKYILTITFFLQNFVVAGELKLPSIFFTYEAFVYF